MPTLVVPATVRDFLQVATAETELYDAGGNLLGRYTPAPASQRNPFNEPPPLTKEEIDRIMAEPGYTSEEVMAHLERL